MICRRGAVLSAARAATPRCCVPLSRNRLPASAVAAAAQNWNSSAAPSTSCSDEALPSSSAGGVSDVPSFAARVLRASVPAMMLAAAVLVTPLMVPRTLMAPAHAAAAVATQQDLSRRAVEEYSEMEAAGKMKNSKTLDEFRSKYRIRRSMDGRLQVRSSKGEWWSVRLDMEVPGALLLRDPSGGVHAVQTESLQQVDLSDDLVCLLMFADGAWEEQMSIVDYTDETGKSKQLKLDEKEFREVIGLLKEADGWQDDEEEGRK